MGFKNTKKIGLILICLLFLNLFNFNIAQALDNKSNNIENYILEGDPFERSFFGLIKQKIGVVVDNIKNKDSKATIYQDAEIEKVIIDGSTLSKSEIIKNPDKLKQVYINRNKEDGFKNIEIITTDKNRYTYEEYLKITLNEVQPLNIISNTTWTKEGGPYYIGGEVRIFDGATLTIEAGTDVFFYDNKVGPGRSGFLVDGKLVINGTINENVNFQPRNEDSKPGSWEGIYITERGELEANYTNIDKAGAWSRSGIYALGKLTLNNCSVTNTMGDGVNAFRDVYLTNNNISNNSEDGIDIRRFSYDYDTVITSNDINNNNVAGWLIYDDANSSNYNVSGNTTTNNIVNGFKLRGTIGGDMTFTDAGTSTPYIISNLDDYYEYRGNFIVKENTTVTFDKCVVKIDVNPNLFSKNTIEVDGNLNLIGSANKRVKITSIRDNSIYGDTTSLDDGLNPKESDWRGIEVSEKGSINANYVDISYADETINSFGETYIENIKVSNSHTGINVYDTVLSIKNSIFDNVYMNSFVYSTNDKPAKLTLLGNKFENMKEIIGTINLTRSGGDELVVSNNTSKNNIKNGVSFNGSIDIDTSLNNIGTNIPYIISGLRVNKGSTLDIVAGTILKVEDGVMLGYKSGIQNYGTLNLKGTSTNKVVVTSIKDDSVAGDTDGNNISTVERGDWGNISYKNGSNGTIEYSDIKYGGDLIEQCSVGGSGNITIKNTNIKYSSENGIGVGADGSITVLSTTVSNNSKNGINVFGSANVTSSTIDNNDENGIQAVSSSNFNISINSNKFNNNKNYAGYIRFSTSKDKFTGSNNTGTNNRRNGIGITGTLQQDFTLSKVGTNLPFVVDNKIEVIEGKALNVSSGVTVKFEDEAKLDINGKLNTNGTSDSKVYFTSVKDDTIAGDTNNDGSSSSPSKGDWKSINIVGPRGSFNKSNINYSEIRYGGGDKDTDYSIGGTASIQVSNSVVTRSKKNGIGAYGDITLNGSIISENEKCGLDVKNLSQSSNFNLNLSSNTFRNNKDYAAFAQFTHDDDRITGSNNKGINNAINGIGISGDIGANVTLKPAGREFPFVVPDYIKIKEKKTVTLSEGLTIKFGENAKLALEGKLDAEGSAENKVTFTSLKDDTIAGDTNNDGNNSVPSDKQDSAGKDYTDWEGIVYHDNSEGEFKNFECKFSHYNMDYKNIPYVRAIKHNDFRVSISDDKSAYIKNIDNRGQVAIYDYKSRKETIITDNNNSKRDVMIWNNYVAWVENNGSNNIGVYNISSKSINYVNAINVKNLYINDGYLVWTEGSSLQYRPLGGGSTKGIERSVNSTFAPVISSNYIIYKGNDDMIYRTDLKDSNKEYYMLTSTTEHEAADIYGDNIAFLTKDDGASASNIIVGDIPTWTAATVTDNLNVTNSNVALYKDKIMFYNRNVNRNLLIRDASADNSIKNESVLTRGYFVNSNDIGSNSAVFSEEKMVYLLETKFTNDKNEFITGKSDSKTGYNRTLNLGNSLNATLGGKIGADGIVKGGISLSSGKESNLSYTAKRNTYGQNTEIGIGREFIHSGGIEGNIGIGIGDVVGVEGSLSGGGLKKNSDEYFFKPGQDAYKNIGLLTASAMIKNSSQNIMSEICTRILDGSLKSILDVQEKSNDYDTKSGMGANWKAEAEASASASILKSSMGASLSSNAIAEVGKSKENGKYLSFTSAYNGNFSINSGLDINIPDIDKITLGGFTITQDKYKLNILPKLPDIVEVDESFDVEYTINVNRNGMVDIIFADAGAHSNGYVKQYRYTIHKDKIKDNNPLSKRVHSVYNNIDKLDSSLSLQRYNVYGKSVFKELEGLAEILSSEGLKYEVTVAKSNENNLGISFDTDIKEDEEDKKDEVEEKAIIPTIGISVSGKKEDIIDLVIDSGRISNGKVQQENLKIAFIPVNNKLIDNELKNIFRSLNKEINPVTVDYAGNRVEYSNKAKIKSQGDLSHAIFLEAPIKKFKNGESVIDDNQSIIQEKSIYVESFDNNGNKVASYGDDSTLTLKVNNWNNTYKHNYAIYEYRLEDDSWIKLGGKIDFVNKTVTIPINHNGEYAVGIDKSTPNIEWFKNEVKIENETAALTNGIEVKYNDGIRAQIEDDKHIDDSSIKCKISGNGINKEYNGSTVIYHTIKEEAGIYTMTVSYKDIFENEYEEQIKIKVLDSRPIITAKDKKILLGSDFDPKDGVKAYDMDGNDITSSISVVDNKVEINKVGNYTITYRVQDKNGLTSEKTIKVYVE